MNLIYISPHFPRNYIHFVTRLRLCGVQVLGIGSDHFDQLPEALRWGLTEYYRTDVPDDLQKILEAGRYFKSKYGKIERVESHSEYWLPYEAALRDELGVWGLGVPETEALRQKSMMKERFSQAGLQVAKGARIASLEAAVEFADSVGFPLIAKPDCGVGASSTYKLVNREQLVDFFMHQSRTDYFLEEFVDGPIETFDGLVDREGRIVYFNSLVYGTNIMEVVNDNLHVHYFTQRQIEPDLEAVGRRAVSTFQVREKFFHFEFIRRASDKRLIALEANIRPPGGLTIDMWNYADDIDLYLAWARVVSEGRCELSYGRLRHVMYISRKDNLNYAHTHEQVLSACQSFLVHWERISPIFRNALGDTGYLVRSSNLTDLLPLVQYSQELV